ncbi:deoxyuridine 5'-triphosphate nucleotidohydrolase Dut [Desulfofarcimen acetoxidans DSM 771]|uniref:dUTP diphosphatase n=1 Tax=Desulfofarcimen acetoxidans (strain ATCC 49208 / DSM 771 / KCTC 5769 / VKM B-1644 / 5575) TaxID=485916 RepID=C8VXW7_DESAS|nr:dUTP diphosphatase [Desulfofarcimen acetoxidans]ACV64596.1 deoxyuridine 5'-triphosphate nucleotidohydrolase Dut [Desulfofarcimen acetoxidans DSM 771]
MTNTNNLVLVKKLHNDAIIPKRQTELSSGLDLHCLDVVTVNGIKDMYDNGFTFYELDPGERVLVRTGLALQMNPGMEAQIRPRSGLAIKHGITVLNSPATLDSDYRSDIGVILVNHSKDIFTITKGDRIAQLVFQPILHYVNLQETSKLTSTGRGEGGYGHTG